MAHIPFGYQLKEGKAVPHPEETEKLRLFFYFYLEGMSIKRAGEAAGLTFGPSRLIRILRDPVYLGDENYPQLVEEEYYRRAEEVGKERVKSSEDENSLESEKDLGGSVSIVKVIPASPEATPSGSEKPNTKKLRAAAYCRVSTDMEEQETSYEAQVRHYRDYIEGSPDLVLAGIYADEGISGTGTARREAFKRMIRDCEEGRIDLIITKSISRFARNTLDCLKYIRQLKDQGIPIYFEKENINTLDSKGEFLITIMASIAQQESLSISQNVRMGIQYRFQQGKAMLNHTSFMGYNKDSDGNLVIDPEGALVVQRIFREFLEGFSPLYIARRLEAEGVYTPTGSTHWYESTVRSMLRNEKYMGDLLLQKYYTVSYLTKKIAKNSGQFPQYYVENNHPPIIPRDIFWQVQEEFCRRRIKAEESEDFRTYLLEKNSDGRQRMLVMDRSSMDRRNKRGFGGGRLVCGKCGSAYRRILRKGKPADWRCSGRMLLEKEESDCGGENLSEEEIERVVTEAFFRLARKTKKIQKNFRKCEKKRWILTKALDAYGQAERGIGKNINAGEENAWIGKREAAKKDLRQQRAEAAYRSVCLRSLLELVEVIENQDPVTKTEDQKTCGFLGPCFRAADFYLQTKTLGRRKLFLQVEDEDIVRYVDIIFVKEASIKVCFKAGIEVEVSRHSGKKWTKSKQK